MKNIDAVSKVREEDVQHITRLVSMEARTVLEIGCGTGRITFPLAEEASKIIAIDIDASAIEEAQKRNLFENVTFLVENIEDTRLGSTFDVILSTWMGYMYLNNILKAIANISNHLKDDGVFLLCSGSPEDEYNQINNLLVENNIKSVSFYKELEALLSEHFVFEKHMLKGQLVFSNMEEVIERFRLELKTEHRISMDHHHEQRLKEYMNDKDTFAIDYDSQAYLCKKKWMGAPRRSTKPKITLSRIAFSGLPSRG
ncbi:MAG: class I SAM-dependent methyltransferase [Candidatus Thorarchaeota archaeon]|jgi:SAM-dependent methyltransferase